MRVRQVGGSALLIECPDGEHAEAWRAELWRRREIGELTVTDIVPGARTVLLDGVASPAAVESALTRWAPAEGAAGSYAGIYPVASPGGWRLVGRTDTTLFDVRR